MNLSVVFFALCIDFRGVPTTTALISLPFDYWDVLPTVCSVMESGQFSSLVTFINILVPPIPSPVFYDRYLFVVVDMA